MTNRTGLRILTSLAALACGGVISLAAQSTPAEGKGAQIDESKLQKRTRAVACAANQNITLDGVLLDIADAPIQAIGNCKVTIKNSHVKGAAAVQLAGSSDVTIENSLIEGAVAIQLTENAGVSIKSSTIRGKIERAGNVNFKDLGDNKWK
ncbi:MAG TPA: hypothetical protein VGY57_14840 [Vicinamibacterales bacterium]|jgi:hypothetical protein|nr:hypothetical protein [Vicinamibacterales bacterium]